MDELRQMALAYHSTSNQETKDLLSEFFNAMDPNRNGFVTFAEFSEYMALMGHPQMSSEKFFDELKHESRAEHLEPIEVLTLYYIIKSGRPFCDGYCRNFIKGTYFTCEKCLTQDGSYTFNVCPQCVSDKKYVHDYDHKEFVDPFTLLHCRKMESFENYHATSPMPSAPSLIESFYNIADSAGHTNSTFLNELRERQNRQMNNKHFGDRVAQLVQIGLSLGNLLASVGACTIM